MIDKAKKSLGQHWLTDKNILSKICDIADVRPEDMVLEVGPGHGSLTQELLKSGAKVTAVELDNDLADTLPQKLENDDLIVINEDILKFNLTSLPEDYKVVANIPYYLTSNLIRILSESNNPPKSITLLVQKEVAERICAGPGGMSLLSVSAQVYYDCELGPVVKAEMFTPSPKVDSQIVNMLRKSTLMVDETNKKHFFKIVKAGFANRRKTLQNSLAGSLQIPKNDVSRILKDANISASSRPQELSMSDWVRLAKTIDL